MTSRLYRHVLLRTMPWFINIIPWNCTWIQWIVDSRASCGNNPKGHSSPISSFPSHTNSPLTHQGTQSKFADSCPCPDNQHCGQSCRLHFRVLSSAGAVKWWWWDRNITEQSTSKWLCYPCHNNNIIRERQISPWLITFGHDQDSGVMSDMLFGQHDIIAKEVSEELLCLLSEENNSFVTRGLVLIRIKGKAGDAQLLWITQLIIVAIKKLRRLSLWMRCEWPI